MSNNLTYALWVIPSFLGFCVGNWIADYFLSEYWFTPFERSLGERHGRMLDGLANMFLRLLFVAPFVAVGVVTAIELMDLASSIGRMIE